MFADLSDLLKRTDTFLVKERKTTVKRDDGSAPNSKKFSEEDVALMRDCRMSSFSLAEKIGVSHSTVRRYRLNILKMRMPNTGRFGAFGNVKKAKK